MTVDTLVLGPLETNCYILTSNSAPGKALVVDPAFHAEKILEFLSSRALSAEAVLLTHTHFDHMYALDAFCNATNAPLFCPELDKYGLCDPVTNASRTLVHRDLVIGTKPTRFLRDLDRVALGNEYLTVLDTPGHTRGSICYKTDDFILSGDTLFYHGNGRTDLEGGSEEEMRASLHRILSLDDMTVYPGHGNKTTIENERRFFRRIEY